MLTHLVAVLVDRRGVHDSVALLGISKLYIAARAFPASPAIVHTWFDDVHLLEIVCTHTQRTPQNSTIKPTAHFMRVQIPHRTAAERVSVSEREAFRSYESTHLVKTLCRTTQDVRHAVNHVPWPTSAQ